MTSNNTLSLCNISIGDSCYIKEIVDYSEKFKKRMFDLGFVYNSRITPLYSSMFGGTIAYLIKGSVIALREKDANKILVSFRR